MLSHRAHTETLQLQMEANDLQLKSTDAFAQASNGWAYFQSKKNRQYLYETAAIQSRANLEGPGASTASGKWKEQVEKDIKGWETASSRYKQETADIEQKALEHTNQSKKYQEES